MNQTPADGTSGQGGSRAGKAGGRIIRAAFLAIGALLLLAGLVLGGLFATGATLRLPYSTEKLLAWVNEPGSEYRVTARSGGFSWTPREGSLQVHLNDAVLQHVSGTRIGTARRLQIGGSARGFLDGNLEAARIEFDGLNATLRTGSGPAVFLAAGGGAYAVDAIRPNIPAAGASAAIKFDLYLTDSRLGWMRGESSPTVWTDAQMHYAPTADGFRMMGEATPEVAGRRGRVGFSLSGTPKGSDLAVEIEGVAASALLPDLEGGAAVSGEAQFHVPADGGPRTARGSAQVSGALLTPLVGIRLDPDAPVAVRFEAAAAVAPDGSTGRISGRIDAGGQVVSLEEGGTITVDTLEAAFAADASLNRVDLEDIRLASDRAALSGKISLLSTDEDHTLIFSLKDVTIPALREFHSQPLAAVEGRADFNASENFIALTGTKIQFGENSLEVSASLRGEALEANLALSAWKMSELVRVWPEDFAANGRRWVRENIEDGIVDGTIRLSGPLGNPEITLTDTTIQFGENSLALAASLRGGELEATLALPAWKASDLAQVWPEDYAADGRRWVRENIEDGIVDGAIRLSGPLDDPDVALEFGFTDTVLGAIADFPPVVEGAGTGTLRDGRLAISISNGIITPEPGKSAIDLTGSQFEIANIADFSRPGQLTLHLDGAAARIIALATRIPIGFFPPEAVLAPVQGSARTRVDLAIPLDVPVTRDNVPYTVSGTFDAVGLGIEDSGLQAEKGKGNFRISAGAVRIGGEALVNGIPLTFEAVTALADTAEAVPEAWAVSGTVQDLDAVVPAGLEMESGAVPFAAELRWDSGSGWSFGIDSGLEGVKLAIGPYVLKEAHQNATLDVEGHIGKAGITLGSARVRLPSLALETSPAPSRPGWLRFSGSVGGDLITRSDVPVESASALPVSGIFHLGQDDAPAEFSFLVDFTGAKVELDTANWTKPAGEPAELAVSGFWPAPDQQVTFRFSSGSVVLGGEWRDMPAGGDWAVRINPLKIGRGTLLALTAGPEDENPRTLHIAGRALDLRDFGSLTDVRPSGASPEGAAAETGGRQFNAELQLGRLHMNNELWMADVQGTLLLGPGRQIEGKVTGQTFGLLDTSVVAKSGPEKPQILVEIDDAGGMLRAMGMVDSVRGGRVVIEPIFADESETGPSYRVRMLDFSVEDAPLLARLLSFISGIGLINYILEGSTAFESLEMRVTEDGDLLRMTEGIVESASLGFVFVGDLNTATDEIDIRGFATPLRFLTRILGEIPVLGNLIQDSDGTTSIAVGFQIRGPRDDPTVYAQPLTALVPFLPRLQTLETEAGTGAPRAPRPQQDP